MSFLSGARACFRVDGDVEAQRRAWGEGFAASGRAALSDRHRAVLLWVCVLSICWLGGVRRGAAAPVLYPVPAEVRSTHFVVTVDGKSTPVMHAATGYDTLSFDVGPAGDPDPYRAMTISVTAEKDGFWDGGVEVEPMRLGLRPVRHGRTITFTIHGPQKLSIERPGDHFADGQMLFLFANLPETSGITAATPGVRYYGPGVHRENIDAQSGDTIYLAGGAVILGALNIWQVENVRVLGRGTILYDGPQNSTFDQGWMHKRNWHVIVMDNAHNIEIDGITCIVRSRTWQIQMKDSREIGFNNIKVIGGSASDANQDGMDWLGGGGTSVRDSFFRASDDVFALQGNWDGYSEAAMLTPGHDVSDITIENSVVTTSISNIIRVNWPQKIFNSSHFVMKNMDVLNTGYGACKVPFAFFELWADPAGKGSHTGYHFEDIRLSDWYSLTQIRQPNPRVRDITFQDVFAMDGPGMVPSVLSGDVRGVTLDDVRTGTQVATGDAAVPLEEANGAAVPAYTVQGGADAGFTVPTGLVELGKAAAFTATAADTDAGTLQYHWFFGDGSEGDGRAVRHVFRDAEGTLLDGTALNGSGRFRVLLRVKDAATGRTAWGERGVVVARAARPAVAGGTVLEASLQPGLAAGVDSSLPSGQTADAHVSTGYLRVPATGGYTFTLLSAGTGTLAIDGVTILSSPKPRAQVCGSPGDAVQAAVGSMALEAGLHRVRMVASGDAGPAEVEWESGGLQRVTVPAEDWVHGQP
jgi:hypothetical protein